MKKFCYIILLLLFIASCKKYEEGPDFTLRTILSRIDGEWTPTKVYVDGKDSTEYNLVDKIVIFACSEEDNLCFKYRKPYLRKSPMHKYEKNPITGEYLNLNDGRGYLRYTWLLKDNYESIMFELAPFSLSTFYYYDSIQEKYKVNNRYLELGNTYEIKKLTNKEMVLKLDIIRLEFKKDNE